MARAGVASEVASFQNIRALIRDRLSARGRRVAALAGALAILGIDTRRNQTFLLFSAVAATLFVAFVAAWFRRVRARLDLTLPRRVTAGRVVQLRARIVPERDARGDALLGFPAKRRPAAITVMPWQEIVPLDAAHEVALSLHVARRGRYEMRTPTLRALDPFALVAGPARRPLTHVILAHPPLFDLDHLQLDAGRKLQPGGIPLLASTGDAVEFVGTRDYRPGDPLRRVHFRSWARRGAPVVKEYQEEYVSRVALVIDTWTGRSPNASEAFERSLSLVASIADHFGRTEQVLDVLAAGDRVHHLSTGRGLGSLEEVLDVLACLEPAQGEPFASLEPTLFAELAQITTVVTVMLDWDDSRKRFLESIRALGTEVRAFVVRSGETTLPLDGALPIERMSPDDIASAIERTT